MKLTKERKVYAAVLGLGLTVLAVDRLFLGGQTLGPGSASAAAPVTPEPLATEPVMEKGVLLGATAPGIALATRLEGIRPEMPRQIVPASIMSLDSPLHPGQRSLLKNPAPSMGLFSTKAGWLVASEAAVAAAKQEPEKAKEKLKDVLARHKINTVVIAGPDGSESFLLVDDKLRDPLKAGASFDGIKILAITKGRPAVGKTPRVPSTVTLGFGDERMVVEFENIGADR